ncbi:hypothetical protein BpHYR1_004703 [Brachionus plicatilis]|uniref:Uncharacterized protein n=1 Tax=Brachionus plicatilis TaxID=10195 RepID=A0A3M7T2J8_BRAPC|nr:hypothetical protein BpHYR1_004703 [Brachionus plicatilis]
MNFTIQNFLRSDHTICNLSKFFLLCLSIVWTLIISLFFQIILSKLVSHKIAKYLEHKILAAKFDFSLESTSFNFILLRFVFKNVHICIENFCHIQIPELHIGLNRFDKTKKYILYFFDAKVIFFDQIIFNQHDSFNIVQNVPPDFVNYFYNLTLSLNHMRTDSTTTCVHIKNLAFILHSDYLAQNLHQYRSGAKNPIYIKQNSPLLSTDLATHKKVVLVNFLDLSVSLMSENGRDLNFLKVAKAKLSAHFGQLEEYNFKSNGKNFQISNLAFSIDLFGLEKIHIELDVWNGHFALLAQDLALICKSFLSGHTNWVINIKMKDYQVSLCNGSQKLVNIFSHSQSSVIEIANLTDKFLICKCLLKNVWIMSVVNEEPVFFSSSVYVSTKFESTIASIKMSFGQNASFWLSKIGANLELVDLILTSGLLEKSDFKFVLIGSMESVTIVLPFGQNSLRIDIKQMGFKMERVDQLMSIAILEELSLFTDLSYFNLEQNLSAKCERLVMETKSSVDGTKFQFILSPVQIGPQNLFEQLKILNRENSHSNLSHASFESYLYTETVEEVSSGDSESANISLNNCLFLSVFQCRYELFRNGAEKYAEFCELVLGDIFGSLNFENFLKLIDLTSSIWRFCHQELAFLDLITKTNLNYSNFRLCTSLTNINILNDYDTTKPVILFNLIAAPIDHGACDFHCEHKSAGSLTTITDLSLKIFSQLNSLNKSELVECGIFYFKFLSHLKINKCDNRDKMLDYLTQCDQYSKRLDFLWHSDTAECCCVANSSFFSHKKEKMYNYDNECVLKPSVYWLERSGEAKVGFGQSIVDATESTFFSYRKFFSEYDLHSNKIRAGKKFTVISNLESNEKYIRSKFEPVEISVFDQELNTFMNESMDASGARTSDLGFKSTNMTPPCFCTEFSVYVRYLPKIKMFSNVTFRAGEQSLPTHCHSQVVYPEDGVNTPHSDLDAEFFSKTSTVFKRLRFKWLKSRKKSYKKSLLKKSVHLKEMKSLKLTNVSSISSLSLSDSLSDTSAPKNTNQNNNQTKRATKPLSNFFIYHLNLKQIVHGFKPNNTSEQRSADEHKKLCVQELYIQTLLLSDHYDYENTHKNFIFEKKINADNQQWDERCSSDASNKMHSSKVYVLLSRESVDCVSSLVECVHEAMRQMDVETKDEGGECERHVSVDEAWVRVVEISAGRDVIEAGQACTINMTNVSVNESGCGRLIAVRYLHIRSLHTRLFPIQQLVSNVTLLINKMKLTVNSRTKLVVSNSIIDQFSIPGIQIEMDFFCSLSLQIEIALLELIEPLVKLSMLTDLLCVALTSANACKNLSIKHKICLLVKQTVFKLWLQNRSSQHKNYLLCLNGTDFNFVCTNALDCVLGGHTQVVKYEFGLRVDLVEDRESLIVVEFEVKRRHLDAVCTVNVRPSAPSPNFFLNLVFPLIFQSRFHCSNFDFEWSTPGLLVYSACDNSVYQLVDINNIKICLGVYEEKLLVDLERVRLVRSNIHSDMLDQIGQFVHKIKFDLALLSRFVLIVKIKSLVLSYFADTFLSKSWFFLKIFDVHFTYAFSTGPSLIEDVTVSFRDCLTPGVCVDPTMAADVHQGRLLDVKNSILLFVSSKSRVLDQFDLNKWLDFCCMESRDGHGYRNNLALIEQKIVAKLKRQKASMMNRVNEIYADERRRHRMDVGIREMDGSWMNGNNLDVFDSQYLSYLLRNCLLDKILVHFTIINDLNELLAYCVHRQKFASFKIIKPLITHVVDTNILQTYL